MTRDEMLAFFKVAQIEVLNHWELPNGYWPKAYAVQRELEPWWLVKTSAGCVVIGRRKRVWSIDWSDTPIRFIVTDHDVTKDLTMVHAWTTVELVCHLVELGKKIEELKP